jgi:hypothetical protein
VTDAADDGFRIQTDPELLQLSAVPGGTARGWAARWWPRSRRLDVDKRFYDKPLGVLRGAMYEALPDAGLDDTDHTDLLEWVHFDLTSAVVDRNDIGHAFRRGLGPLDAGDGGDVVDLTVTDPIMRAVPRRS